MRHDHGRAAAPVEDEIPVSVGAAVGAETPADDGPDASHVGAVRGDAPRGFLPAEPERHGAESIAARLIATAGVIGIGTALAAILVANDVVGWIVGLAVSTTAVILSAVLWRSRRL